MNLSKTIDSKFKSNWLNYVIQSVLLTFAVFVTLRLLRYQNLVIAASLAATAFTVFTMPNAVTSSNRNLIGGHLIGLAFGSLFALFPNFSGLSQDIIYALTVGSAMFAMTITNTEHPPAAGTALGVVIAGFSYPVILGVIAGILILAVILTFLRPLMMDLIVLKPDEKDPGKEI